MRFSRCREKSGASSGVGEAIARYLALSGAAVAINYHSEAESAQKVVDDIKTANGEAFAIQADVSKEDEIKPMFSQTIQQNEWVMWKMSPKQQFGWLLMTLIMSMVQLCL